MIEIFESLHVSTAVAGGYDNNNTDAQQNYRLHTRETTKNDTAVIAASIIDGLPFRIAYHFTTAPYPYFSPGEFSESVIPISLNRYHSSSSASTQISC